MSTNWTVWCRPNRCRHWELIGEAATEREARRLMLADDRSGGYLTLAPGKPYPTPNRERQPIPNPHARPEPAEATRP